VVPYGAFWDGRPEDSGFPARPGKRGPATGLGSWAGARSTAGLPALHDSEPGQVRKEAATAILCKCRGLGSPPFHRAGQGLPTVDRLPSSTPTPEVERGSVRRTKK
jgi:hypothetical protein